MNAYESNKSKNSRQLIKTICPQFDIETPQIRNAKLRRTSLSSPGTCEPLHEPTNLHRAACDRFTCLSIVESCTVLAGDF